MIGIISCTKSKYNAENQEARLIYWKSNLFRLSYQVLLKYHPKIKIYILSAKYGLIPGTEIISTYEKTLKTMSEEEKDELRSRINLTEDYVFIGGSEYKNVLPRKPIKEYGRGMSIGHKMSYLKSLL